ncbi:MAG: hypothetical protein IPL86_12170 [Flavobacteriales bacterium]|nr:hypothetical protein [Flavobacteriales bacterium]
MALSTFSQNSIKGRVAETIIQELFLAHEFNVFHYGMERSIPGIAQLTRKTFGAVKQQIAACRTSWCRTRATTSCTSWK